MALQAVNGGFLPYFPMVAGPPTVFTSTTMSASGHKIAWVGPFWNKDRATKSITKVGFLPGAQTSAGGSMMRLSLQNVDATTGVPARGDGTQDQTVDFLNSTLVDGTWFQTAALSAARSLAFAEMVAVVLEFQSYAGADACAVKNLQISSSLNVALTQVSHLTASWATTTLIPNIILEATDGTFGTLLGSFPCSALNTHTFNSSSNPNEHALAFTVPFSCKIDGIWAAVQSGADTRDFSIELYSGQTSPTQLASFAVDSTMMPVTTGRPSFFPIAETELVPGTQYYIAFKPATTGNNSTYSFDVAAAGHLQAHQGGTAFNYSTRNAGDFAAATGTRRLWAGIQISALDDGVGGGGGGASIVMG